MLTAHRYIHLRHACVGYNCVGRQMAVLDGNECVDKMRAQRCVYLLWLKAFAVGRCVNREVTNSLVGGSCRKATRIKNRNFISVTVTLVVSKIKSDIANVEYFRFKKCQ